MFYTFISLLRFLTVCLHPQGLRCYDPSHSSLIPSAGGVVQIGLTLMASVFTGERQSDRHYYKAPAGRDVHYSVDSAARISEMKALHILAWFDGRFAAGFLPRTVHRLPKSG